MSDTPFLIEGEHFSTEKMNFSAFQRHYTAYRQSMIPHQILDLNDARLQLPDRSSLYTTRNFLTYMTEDGEVTPDLENPLVRNEEWRKFLHIETVIANRDSTPYPVIDKLVYMPGRFRGVIQHFFTSNRDYHRTLDDASVDKARNILACHEFSPILYAKLQGNLSAYRKFEILLRTILNKIVSCTAPRYHYIEIPLSDTMYIRNDFIRTTVGINTSTLKGRNDPSYFFLIHFIGFLFNEIAKEAEVKPLPNDQGYLEPDDVTLSKTNSLFNRLPVEVIETINIVFTKGNHAVIYNLGDLKAFTTTIAFVDKVLRHLNTLKMINASDEDKSIYAKMDDKTYQEKVQATQGNDDVSSSNDEPSVGLDQDVPSHDGGDVTPAKDNTTILTSVPTPEPQPTKTPVISPPAAPEDASTHFVKVVQTNLKQTVEKTQRDLGTASDAPTKRAKTLLGKHMAVQIGRASCRERV